MGTSSKHKRTGGAARNERMEKGIDSVCWLRHAGGGKMRYVVMGIQNV